MKICENISVTQGRLVPVSKDKKFKNKIQQFPDKLWKKELTILYQNNIKFIEWVISIENFNLNPITKKNMLKQKQIRYTNKMYGKVCFIIYVDVELFVSAV